MKEQSQSDVAKKVLVKKAYVSPKLLEYGSIAKLTQTGGSAGADSMSMQSCL